MQILGFLTNSVTLVLTSLAVIWGLRVLQNHRKKKERYLPRLEDIEIPKKWIPVGKLITLTMYPLKSGKRLPIDRATCNQLGLKEVKSDGKLCLKDRSFILFDDIRKTMVTMGKIPEILHVETKPVDNESVMFTHPLAAADLTLKLPSSNDGNSTPVTVLLKNISALDCGDEAATWFSQLLLKKDDGLRLLYHDRLESFQPKMKNLTDYYTELRKEHAGTFTNMASFMLLGESSVADLNTRLNLPVTFRNFRPNFLVQGTEPYAEDKWEWVKIGDEVVFRCIKSTARCTQITINPETASRNPELEPYRTLKKYRTLPTEEAKKLEGDSPIMGLYLGLHRAGDIKVGDTVYINEKD